MATILTISIIALMTAGAVYTLIKDKKAGKSSCGCACSSCPNAAYCHKDRPSEKEKHT